MKSHMSSTAFCSCLTIKTDRGFTHFDNEAVAEFMLEFFNITTAGFACMSPEEFKPYYRDATNAIFKQSSYYKNLTKVEQMAMEDILPTRCAGCGFHVLRLFRERSDRMKEAA